MASSLFFCGAMDGCLPCLSGWKPARGVSQWPSSGKPLPSSSQWHSAGLSQAVVFCFRPLLPRSCPELLVGSLAGGLSTNKFQTIVHALLGTLCHHFSTYPRLLLDRRTRPCLSPSPLAQAIQEIGEFREKFGIGGAHRSEDEWASTAKLARCTFVEGLLIHAFKAARDKVTLRNQVQKHLKLLGNGATKDDLAPCLRIRADRALKFQIPL